MPYNICKFCKKRYGNHINDVYCSDACKLGYDQLPDKACKECTISLPKITKKQFCSAKCHNQYQQRINMVEHTCVQCNQPFQIKRSSKRKKTCSVNCETLWAKSTTRNTTRMNSLRENNRRKYGTEHTFQRNDVIDSIKETKTKRYGSPGFCNPTQGKQTKLNRYGTAGYNNVSKIKDTKLQRYGKLHFNEKSNVTKLNKYGTLDFSSKAQQTTLDRYGTTNFSAKAKQTILNTYGSTEGYTNHLLRKSYERLQNKYAHVTFLFTAEQYTGTHHYTLYPFECTVCFTTFDDYMTNGLAPTCPSCNPKQSGTSTVETDIVKWLRMEFPTLTFETNTRRVISPLELDIYCPEKNIAIEVNGVYWHSEIAGGKSKFYHVEKTKLSMAKGMQLIHILDVEWSTRQHIVQSILRNKFGSSNKLYARKCVVHSVDSAVARKFFDQHHIQGYSNASVTLGLFSEGRLLSCMSFTKHRFSRDPSWEIVRFATIDNTSVIGGAAKLFTYFIRHYSPDTIISYSDLRWFTGGVYTSIGMTRQKNTPPAYTYVGPKSTLYNRITFQKHKLHTKLQNFDPILTEWENMKNNGYDRIWDCGHAKYVWTKKDPLE